MKYDSRVAQSPAEEGNAVCCFVSIVCMWEEAAPNLSPDHQASAWTQAQTPTVSKFMGKL